MSDILSLAVMASAALSCSLAVVLLDEIVLPALKAFHRRLTEQLHRHRADADRVVVGDWPGVPDDLKIRNHAERNSL